MQIRKILMMSAMALTVMSMAPAMAEDGKEGAGMNHEKMMRGDADTDGDGKLSKAEFMAVQEKRFSEMDGNGDGSVTKDEMKTHFEKMREMYKEKRKEMSDMMKEKADKKAEEKSAQ